MKRIRRLTMESRGRQASVAPAASAAVVLVLFAAALTALPAKLPTAHHGHLPTPARVAMATAAETPPQAAAQTMPTPYRKWLHEDVAYIISDEERAAFQALTSDAERDNFIEQFWKRRDPTPDTEENEYREEHYRRIAYTNEHFAGSVPGWKTDRGRMYIVYGPPDELDDHSSGNASNPHPYQQWRYRYIEGVGTNVILEFEDRDGTGDYQMTKDPSAMPAKYAKWLRETLQHLEAGMAIGLRVEQTGPESVTVHVPLDSPGDRYHLLEEVRTPDGRMIQSRAADPTGPEFSQAISLRAGKYQLVVVMKNLATGTSRRAVLNFTVN